MPSSPVRAAPLSTVARLLFLTVFLVACRDTTEPRQMAASLAPRREIMDGGHNGGSLHFNFLPPLVNAQRFTGTFDPAVDATLEICALQNAVCTGAPAATFSTHGSGDAAIKVDATSEQYVIQWRTNSPALDANGVYRIRVKVLNTELGHVDVTFAKSSPAGRGNSANDAIVLNRGETVPLRFRIEKGAFAVISPAGGRATLADGNVSLTFAPGAVTTASAITAGAVAPGGTNVTDGAVLPGTQYEFQPSPTSFSAPVTVSITYPAVLPRAVKASRLSVCKMSDGACVPLNGSTVDPSTHTVSASISSFSSYGATQFPEMCYMLPSGAGFWLHTPTGEISMPACGGHLYYDAEGIRDTDWNPDGSKMVYCIESCWGYGGNLQGSIHVVDADGTNDHVLVPWGAPSSTGTFTTFSCPRWSRDGTKVLFDWGGGRPGIVNADGTGLRDFGDLTTAPACGQLLSPDGNSIMMLGGVPCECGIATMNVDGSGQHLLVPTSYYSKLIGYSADGSLFAFYASGAGDITGTGIYVMRSDGTHLKLALPGVNQNAAEWSPIPGDNRLAFTRTGSTCDYCDYDPSKAGLFIANSDGSGEQTILSGTLAPGNPPRGPRWSPDGTRIAVEWVNGPIPLDESAGTSRATYIVGVDGSGLQLLLGSGRGSTYAVWRP